jgi:hypothetical protein
MLLIPATEEPKRRTVLLTSALIIFAAIFGLIFAVTLKPAWFAIGDPQAAFLNASFKGLAGFVGVAGAALTLRKYFDEKRRENRIALIEAQKPFSTKRQEVYFELISSTSTIANRGSNDVARKKAEAKFWWLFWGAVPMVADDQVAAAVDNFSAAVQEQADDGVALRNSSLRLAQACRKSLGFLDYS